MNIIDSLANGDVLKYSEVEDLEVSTAWAKLYLEKEKSEYKKRLQEIHERNDRKNSKRGRK